MTVASLREHRRWLVPNLMVTAVLPAGLGTAARADHGAWHHNNHVWDPAPSSYSGYAHTYGTDSVDFLYARFIVWRNGVKVVDRNVSCGPVDEGCAVVRTTTGSWPQGGSQTVQSRHCGRDGRHEITVIGPTTCRITGSTGTEFHQQSWTD